MSSMLRKYSQIPVRAKYLLAVAAGDAVGPNPSDVSAFTLNSGEHIYVSSIASNDDILTGGHGFAIEPIAEGALYKDMGRQIVIYDAEQRHIAVFRQVQLVSGGDTEGVCPAADRCANIYVKVWSADGLGVVVVRTG